MLSLFCYIQPFFAKYVLWVLNKIFRAADVMLFVSDYYVDKIESCFANQPIVRSVNTIYLVQKHNCIYSAFPSCFIVGKCPLFSTIHLFLYKMLSSIRCKIIFAVELITDWKRTSFRKHENNGEGNVIVGGYVCFWISQTDV